MSVSEGISSLLNCFWLKPAPELCLEL